MVGYIDPLKCCKIQSLCRVSEKLLASLSLTSKQENVFSIEGNLMEWKL